MAVIGLGEVQRHDALEVTRDAALAGEVDEIEGQALGILR